MSSHDDPFALLGLPHAFALDRAALDARHRELSATHHPDRLVDASHAERVRAIEKAAAINEAHRTLRDPQRRAQALLERAGRPLTENTRAPESVLMQVLALREALDDAGQARDEGRLAAIRDEAAARIAEDERCVSAAFPATGEARAEALDAAFEATVRLRYFRRLVEEAEALLDPDA